MAGGGALASRALRELPQSGVYVLVAGVGRERTLRHGVLGDLRMRPGYYAYVGHARRGLPARLARHALAGKQGKRLFWHIDYFLEMSSLEKVWLYPLEVGECSLATALEERGGDRGGLAGFGSSDCRCPGHLLYFGEKRPLPGDGSLPRVSTFLTCRPPSPLR